MKRTMLAVTTASVLGFFGSVAYAGTCGSPDNLPSNATVNGTTCGGVIGLNLGGAIYGHPSNVYSFIYQPDANTGTEPDQIELQGTNIEATLVTSCNDNGTMGPAGLAVATGDGAVVVPVDGIGLVAGSTYYLVVSTDPSIPVNPTTPVCGDFTVNTDDLPVELTSFTVD